MVQGGLRFEGLGFGIQAFGRKGQRGSSSGSCKR